MYKILFLGLDLLAKLPFGLLYALSDLFFYLLYYVIGYRKKVVRENLTNSFPQKTSAEIDQIMKEFYHHFCDLVIESIKSVGMTADDFNARYKVTNIEVLLAYSRKNISVILLSSHHSNWEWVCFLPSLIVDYFKVFAIYKPLTNQAFDEYVKRTRQKHTATLIPMKDTFRTVLTYAPQQTILTWMAADQTPSKEAGHWVQFLNQDTPFFAGYDKLARQMNQAVLFLDIVKIKRGHYELTLTPLCDNPQDVEPYYIVEQFAAQTEKQIQKQPAYWLWSHRRWKHKRETRS
jgi:KDO2-lipid IV(A) lauroyltransferase